MIYTIKSHKMHCKAVECLSFKIHARASVSILFSLRFAVPPCFFKRPGFTVFQDTKVWIYWEGILIFGDLVLHSINIGANSKFVVQIFHHRVLFSREKCCEEFDSSIKTQKPTYPSNLDFTALLCKSAPEIDR